MSPLSLKLNYKVRGIGDCVDIPSKHKNELVCVAGEKQRSVFSKYLTKMKDRNKLNHLAKLLNVYHAAKVTELPRITPIKAREVRFGIIVCIWYKSALPLLIAHHLQNTRQ